MHRPAQIRRGIILTLLGGSIWGINGTVAQYLLATYHIPVLWLVCIRELSCCWCFFACAWCFDRQRARVAFTSAKALMALAACGLIVILSTQIAYLEAIRLTNSATATVLQCLGAVFVLAYVCLHAHRRPTRREALGVLCALLGTFVLATGGNFSALSLPLDGLIWGLIDAVTVAGMSIIPLGLMRKHGNFMVNGVGFLASGLTLSAFYHPWTHMPTLDAMGWALLAFTCFMGTFVAYALYLQGVAYAGSVRASMLGTIEPAMATITTVVFLGSTFTPFDLVGFVLIVAMVMLTAGSDVDKSAVS